jgi:hypothetical protein
MERQRTRYMGRGESENFLSHQNYKEKKCISNIPG